MPGAADAPTDGPCRALPRSPTEPPPVVKKGTSTFLWLCSPLLRSAEALGTGETLSPDEAGRDEELGFSPVIWSCPGAVANNDASGKDEGGSSSQPPRSEEAGCRQEAQNPALALGIRRMVTSEDPQPPVWVQEEPLVG